ncbi:DUF6518 family protein [Modestobacter sp. SSW1-42]|uniref:DUF6518 family protein n=1 Tax=Modestobacter sp. SSW1-42 TaxID=596372 RepID=UPI003988752A
MTQLTVSPGTRAAAGPVLAVAGGLVTGGFAAWAYYGEAFRPLAHSFGLWIALLALLSARRPVREAVLRSVLALATAVVAFYVGKDVMYGIEYPGQPYAVDLGELVQWLVLSVVAGSLLGWAFRRIGRPGHAGAASTAAALGLLLADAYRRSSNYPADAVVVVGFAVLAAVAVLAVAVRSPRQLAEVALWTVPAAAAGWVLVSAPDLLEQLLITGSL